MNEQEFCELVKSSIDRLEDVNLGDILQDYDEWDSLNLLNLISSIDEKYNFVIDGNSIKNDTTVLDIYNIVKSSKG